MATTINSTRTYPPAPPPVTYLIATHTPTGFSTFEPTSGPILQSDVEPHIKTSLIHSTHTNPIDLSNDLELHNAMASAPLGPHEINKAGVIVRILNIAPQAPGSKPFMHRNEGLDYAVIISGACEVWVEGEDGKGEVRILRQGDVVVQRGAMHGWRVVGDEWCRMAVWQWPAEAVKAGDEILKGDRSGEAGEVIDFERTVKPEHEAPAPLGANGLRPVNRLVSTHTEGGKSIFDASSGPVPALGPAPVLKFSLLHSTHTDPIDFSSDLALHDAMASSPPVAIVNKSGAIFRMVDMAPPAEGFKPFMHRTESLDYGIVISGAVECWLEGENGKGEMRVMKQGDVVVQRGSMHGWRVSGNEWCRLACVQMPARPLKVGDKILGEDMSGAAVAKLEL